MERKQENVMVERAFPLQWPEGRPRTPRNSVTYSRFDVTPGTAQMHMIDQIKMMGGRYVVISTNLQVKKDGTLYARDMDRTPEDAGVAVYFERKGERVCFCCDRYHKIWENMRAIGKTIEAMRGIERWGSAEMLDRAFTGFAALPAPSEKSAHPHWTTVLEVSSDASSDEIERAYRRLAKEMHPDRGGTDELMAMLNRARQDALRRAENG